MEKCSSTSINITVLSASVYFSTYITPFKDRALSKWNIQMYILISSNKEEKMEKTFPYVHLALQVEKESEKTTTVRNEE